MGKDISVSMLGDFRNFNAWAKRVSSISPRDTLEKVGSSIDSRLASAGPRRTGVMDASWGKDITETKSGFELNITNDAYPKLKIPLPLMLYHGHGTGTGGYVAPRDFITPVLDPAFKDAANQIAKEIIGNG